MPDSYKALQPAPPARPCPAPLPNGGCRRLCCFSAGGVTVGLVICWFKLFICFSLPVMLPSVFPRLATDLAGRVFPSVWKPLFLKFPSWDGLPFQGQNSLPTFFVSFFIFYIFSYLFLKTMVCFSGCLMSPASLQKLFCGVCSALKCSFEEFVREKVVFPSYSSAIFDSLPKLF